MLVLSMEGGGSLLIWPLIAASLFVGWGVGANDAANAMGTAVGAKVRSIREAVILVTVCGIVGALLFGGRVISTVGEGIFPMDQLEPQLRLLYALVVFIAAGITVAVSSWLRLPVSTSQAMIGGVIGCAFALRLGDVVHWRTVSHVAMGWLITPISAAGLGFLMYSIGRWLTRLFGGRRMKKSHIGAFLTLSGCAMALAWGANDVANVVGPLIGAGVMTSFTGALMGSAAMGVGVMTWGPRIMNTVGDRITRLHPEMALAAEIAAAINILIFTLMGLPASSSHTIVGTVFGVGLVKGRSSIDHQVLLEILLAWIITPLVGSALGFAGFRGLRLLFAMSGNI